MIELRMGIKSLPVEDILWLLESKVKDSKTIILTLSNKHSAVLAAKEFNKDGKYDEEVYSLVCFAILHPRIGRPRRPRFFNFKDDRIAKNFDLDLKSKLGIICLYDVGWTQEVEEHLVFRECAACHLRATKELFISCPHCGVTLYCGNKCMEKDWEYGDQSHRKWCHRILGYMSDVKTLMESPFTYLAETTEDEFDSFKYRKFLQSRGVYNQGLWRSEVCLPGSPSVPSGSFVDDIDSSSYVLPVEDTVLQEPINTAVPHPEKLCNWGEYHELRGLSLDSPVAILLQWPLTLYWIMSVCLPRDYGWSLPARDKEISIHMLGVEKECDIFHVFKELGYLLQGRHLHIHMFGRKINKALNGVDMVTGQVKVTFHRKFYHKVSNINRPDFVIGFNAGLAAYSSWIPTLSLLQEQKIPSYFTDYCKQSIDLAGHALSQMKTSASVSTADRVDGFSVSTPTALQSTVSHTQPCSHSTQNDQSFLSPVVRNEQQNLTLESTGITYSNCIVNTTSGIAESKKLPENNSDCGVHTGVACKQGISDRCDMTFSDMEINPFRSPVRIFCPDHNVPWFSNAVLFHLVYV